MAVSKLPSSIVLDLDAAKRPEKEVKPPFIVLIREREIHMEDPANLDWRDLLLLDDPTQFLRLALSNEDRKFLLEQDLEGWRFNQLMSAYYTHYDLAERQAEAQRQNRLTGV